MQILKFESNTCGPCKKLDKILNNLGIKVKHIDATKNLNECRKYQITTLPTLIKLKADNTFEKLNGFHDIEKIKEFCQ